MLELEKYEDDEDKNVKKQETRNAPKVTAGKTAKDILGKKMRWLCRNATNFQTYSHYFTIDSLFTWWK